MQAALLTTVDLNRLAGRWLETELRWSPDGNRAIWRAGGMPFLPCSDVLDAIKLLKPLNAAGWYALLMQIDGWRWLVKLKNSGVAETNFQAVEPTLPLALTRAAVWALPA